MQFRSLRTMARLLLVMTPIILAAPALVSAGCAPKQKLAWVNPNTIPTKKLQFPDWLEGSWKRGEESADKQTVHSDTYTFASGAIVHRSSSFSRKSALSSSTERNFNKDYALLGYDAEETRASDSYRVDWTDDGKKVASDLFERKSESRLLYTSNSISGLTETLELDRVGAEQGPSSSATPEATPSPDAEPNYFPLSDGIEWTYELAIDGRRVGRVSMKAGAVQNENGVVSTTITHTMTTFDAEGHQQEKTQRFTYRKVADELSYETEQGLRRIELKLPLEVGDAWMDNGLKVSVEGLETATVPFKTFEQAVKVVASGSDGASATNWYADGYGLVKSETAAADGSTLSFELIAHKTFYFSDAREDGSNPTH